MAENDWKSRLGVVYSTNPLYQYSKEEEESQESTPPNEEQKLIVSIDRRDRGGKQVTLVTGFMGSNHALEELGKILKNRCGTGGSVKAGQIIIQGDMRERVLSLLLSMGYKAKRGN